MVIDRSLVAVWAGELESDTLTVNLEMPFVVGVPEISPLAVFRVRPSGSEPDAIDHVRGLVPPATSTPSEYRRPTRPSSNRLVVMRRLPGWGSFLVVIDRALVPLWAGELESVAMTVKLAVPAVVGVPEMAPVEIGR